MLAEAGDSQAEIAELAAAGVTRLDGAPPSSPARPAGHLGNTPPLSRPTT